MPPQAPIVWRCVVPSLFESSHVVIETRTILRIHTGNVMLIESNISLKKSNSKNRSSLNEKIANAPGAIVVNRNVVQNTHDKGDNDLISFMSIINNILSEIDLVNVLVEMTYSAQSNL